MYRGAWAEWEIENIEMCVPLSPEELRAKRNSILKHQSQMESAPFLGNDERLFWQRAEDRNRGTAQLYDELGLACYETDDDERYHKAQELAEDTIEGEECSDGSFIEEIAENYTQDDGNDDSCQKWCFDFCQKWHFDSFHIRSVAF